MADKNLLLEDIKVTKFSLFDHCFPWSQESNLSGKMKGNVLGQLAPVFPLMRVMLYTSWSD